MKTTKAVELFGILKDLKISGVQSSEGFKLIMLTRNIRSIVDKYNTDRMLAEEQLKPEGYDDLIIKSFESRDAVLNGLEATISPEEIARLKNLSHLYNALVKPVVIGIYDKKSKTLVGGLDNEEFDVKVEHISVEAFNKLCSDNEKMTFGERALLLDVLLDFD